MTLKIKEVCLETWWTIHGIGKATFYRYKELAKAGKQVEGHGNLESKSFTHILCKLLPCFEHSLCLMLTNATQNEDIGIWRESPYNDFAIGILLE